jgi:negative regulator of flagellin synthesis FlgM
MYDPSTKADPMTPIDPAKLKAAQRLQTGSVTPLQRAAPIRSVASAPGGSAQAPAAALNSASAGTNAPVDADRVVEIRKAVEQGSYPLLPTRIADAMIAAGYLLRAPQ